MCGILKVFRRSLRRSSDRQRKRGLGTGAVLPSGKPLYEDFTDRSVREAKVAQLSKMRLTGKILWRGFLAHVFLGMLLILIGGEQMHREGLRHDVLPYATLTAGLGYAILRLIVGVGRFHAGGTVVAWLFGVVILLEWSDYGQIILPVGAGIVAAGVTFVGWFPLRKGFIRFIDRIIR